MGSSPIQLSFRSVVRWAVLAAACYAAGRAGLLLAAHTGTIDGLSPASAIALGAILVYGPGLWPGVVAGAFGVAWALIPQLAPHHGASVVASLAIAAGTTLQAVGGGVLLRRWAGHHLELLTEHDILRFALIAGPVAAAVGAGAGCFALGVTGTVRPSATLWWTWWAGQSIGLTLFTPVVVALLAPGAVWRRRRVSVAGPLLVSFTLAALFLSWVARVEQRRVHADLERQSQRIALSVRASFDDAIGVLQSVAALHAAAPDSEQGHVFSRFAQATLAANPAVQALSWNPRVLAGDRPAFEQRARAEGDPSFQIVERSGGGALVPARPRAEYVVVWHIEPAASNHQAKGFDVESEPLRAEALRRACTTGAAAATPAIRLVQGPRNAPGMLVFLPVYDEAAASAPSCRSVRGFATGVFRIDVLMRHAVPPADDRELAVTVRDTTSAGPTLVWSNVSEGAAADSAAHAARLDLLYADTFEVAGRRWTVTSAPTLAYVSALLAWRPSLILSALVALSSMLAGFLLTVTGKTAVIERLGAERAAELLDANRRLLGEIAERQNAQEALLAAQEQLQHSQKMDAIGRLAGGVAHDFNNLLMIVSGCAELAALDLGNPERARVPLEEISNAARRGAALTRQLLLFSRREMAEPRLLALNDVVTQLNRMLPRLVGEDVQIRLDLADDVPQVCADVGLIEQVLINLIVNARDAMPRGGTLTIATARHDQTAGGGRRRAYAVLTVADTGVGMDDAVKSHLFEPFYTTKPRGENSGLGLATVYGIVQQNGGHIVVTSEPNCGSCFDVHLPADVAVARANADEDAGTERQTGSETILVVEDEAEVRRLVTQILQRHGYAVLSAGSLDEAMAHVAAIGGRVHLLLTDVVMPGASGPLVAERVRAQVPSLPVLYMSGYTDTALGHYGVLDRDVSLLHKPFSSDELLSKVREILDAAVAGADQWTV